MRRFSLILVLFFVAAFLWPGGEVVSQQVREVWIANFPESQQVEGAVSITDPVPAAKLFQREGVVVPPVDRHETTALVRGGTVEVLGFTEVVLSLQGEVRGAQPRDGEAGALLIPDEGPVLRAFNENSRLQFPLEAVAEITSREAPWMASEATTLPIAFPRYRIYFYNTSNRTVELNLYGYLKN